MTYFEREYITISPRDVTICDGFSVIETIRMFEEGNKFRNINREWYMLLWHYWTKEQYNEYFEVYQTLAN